jgi:hypothetical protein
MDVNAKYKRWGRTAVAGLAAVIVIAGLVIAVTLARDPKPNDEAIVQDPTPEYIAGEDEEKDSEKTENSTDKPAADKPVETPVVSDNTEMPKTGAEDILPSFVLMAMAAALVAYNFELRHKA